MEPGHEDREYLRRATGADHERLPSMEPGHEDREYITGQTTLTGDDVPQWSPVMKTGNTRRLQRPLTGALPPSMEPGHEDREYVLSRSTPGRTMKSLNGARS